MFTGIIAALGTVAAKQPKNGDLRLHVKAPSLSWDDVVLGDSIATNGICLTVVELTDKGFWADVSNETINFTTVVDWSIGNHVNLEKALTPQTRLGGHIVSGHVDGVGEVVSRHRDARSERFTLRAPKSLAKYIAHKGSITVDGTSLTVNAINGCDFELNIVPHTLEKTVFGYYQTGTKVNLEVDLLARYLERLMFGERGDTPQDDGAKATLTTSFLAQYGFMK
jgi:riboflavin synthase